MGCTTILVGKNATYDGSTFMARDDDSGSDDFNIKKFEVVMPEDQPRHYKSVLSAFEMDLPDNPMPYTETPDAVQKAGGIWGQGGINAANVAMTATETITTNPSVQGADPLAMDGIGEEDMPTLVLPYIHSAREGVERLGAILEKYGTYEFNAIGFQDVNDIWWLETIGGHHWIAKRVPDDCYVVMPNQMGIDSFDFVDAFGEQKDHMCSSDMIEFVEKYHLDRTMDEDRDYDDLRKCTDFDSRAAFGSHDDSDHTYNTPRAWFIERYLNPNTFIWDGPDADFTPMSDDLPWCLQPEHKINIEEIKYTMSGYYQNTPYDPYGGYGPDEWRGKFRPIGINRNSVLSLTQIRPYMPEEIQCLQWVALGSCAFNAFVPFYTNVETTPEYFQNTTAKVSTDNFYWSNRLIAAMADAHFQLCANYVEQYQNAIAYKAHALIHSTDEAYAQEKPDGEKLHRFPEKANQEMSDYTQEQTDKLMDQVLFTASMNMKNKYARSDA